MSVLTPWGVGLGWGWRLGVLGFGYGFGLVEWIVAEVALADGPAVGLVAREWDVPLFRVVDLRGWVVVVGRRGLWGGTRPGLLRRPAWWGAALHCLCERSLFFFLGGDSREPELLLVLSSLVFLL
jgi:hypothetical protein